MSYEWKFNKRPYTDDEAKKLLANVVSPETTDWHYNTHHKGYVTALNNIEKALETADRTAANGNFSQIGELKRRFTWNHSGALLHDIYWEVLGGDGDPSKGPEIKRQSRKNSGRSIPGRLILKPRPFRPNLADGDCSYSTDSIPADCLM
jgi:superoxide dismutase